MLQDITYTKNKTPDGNIEYTIIYKAGFMYLADLTKILCNDKNDILAYIDIHQTNKKYDAQFKNLWVNIQEFHPELIGDFTYEINKHNQSSLNDCWTLHPGFWQYDAQKHLYTFNLYTQFGTKQDWFRVHTDPMHDGQIETNFHISNVNDTRFYKFNTHPLAPTGKIELLNKFILYKDGVITKKEFHRYMRQEKKKLNHDIRREKYQNAKRTIGKVLTRAFTDEKA